MSGPPTEIWYSDNDMVVRVDGLRDAVTETFINAGATVEFTLLLPDGTALPTTGSWPVAATYVPGSSGRWEAVIQSDEVTPVPGAILRLRVEASSFGRDAVWYRRVLVRERK